jgi:hypothetical protein
MPKQYYEVLTRDYEDNKWSPQRGVRKGPYTKWGLRKALKKLQAMGYQATKDDPSVLVRSYKKNPPRGYHVTDRDQIEMFQDIA